jgi:hypothetical protein
MRFKKNRAHSEMPCVNYHRVEREMYLSECSQVKPARPSVKGRLKARQSFGR